MRVSCLLKFVMNIVLYVLMMMDVYIEFLFCWRIKKNIGFMLIYVLEDYIKFFNMCIVYEIIFLFYIYL